MFTFLHTATNTMHYAKTFRSAMTIKHRIDRQYGACVTTWPMEVEEVVEIEKPNKQATKVLPAFPQDDHSRLIRTMGHIGHNLGIKAAQGFARNNGLCPKQARPAMQLFAVKGV